MRSKYSERCLLSENMTRIKINKNKIRLLEKNKMKTWMAAAHMLAAFPHQLKANAIRVPSHHVVLCLC